MISRIDQQLRVNGLMLEQVNLRNIRNNHLRQYLYNYFEIITTVSSVLLMKGNQPEHREKRRQLWEFIEKTDPWVYKKLNRSILGRLCNTHTAFGRWICLAGYTISQKIVGFN